MKKQSRHAAQDLTGKLYLARVTRITDEFIYITIPSGISGIILRSQLNTKTQTARTVQYVRDELLVVKYVDVMQGQSVFTPELGDIGQVIRVGEIIQLCLTSEDEGGFHAKRGSFQLIVPRSSLAGREVSVGKYVLAQIREINGKVCKLSLDLMGGHPGAERVNGFPGTTVLGRPGRSLYSSEVLDEYLELEGGALEQKALLCTELAGLSLEGKAANVPLTVYCLDLSQETAYLLRRGDPVKAVSGPETSQARTLVDIFSRECGVNNIIYGAKKLKVVQNNIICRISSPNTSAICYGFIRSGRAMLQNIEKTFDQVVFHVAYIDDFTGILYLTPLNYQNSTNLICIKNYENKEDIPGAIRQLLTQAQLPSSMKATYLTESAFQPGKMIQGIVHITGQLKDRYMCQILTEDDYKRVNCYILYTNLTTSNFMDLNGLRQSFYILEIQQQHERQDDFVLSITQLQYNPKLFCINRNITPIVGQISQGAVVQLTDYTYNIQFLQGMKAKIPLYAAKLELGKVYNFIISNVTSKQIEIIHTNLPCQEKCTDESLLEVFKYKYLQEYDTRQAQFIVDQGTYNQKIMHFQDIVSVHPNGFIVAAQETTLAGKSFILPKSLYNIQLDEIVVIKDILQYGKYTLQQAQQAEIVSTNPPIIAQANYISGQLHPKQQLRLIAIGCTSSYVLFMGPNDIKVRVSCKSQEIVEPYKEYDVIVYEPALGINACWNGRALSWQLPTQNKKQVLSDIQENKRSYELMKTENLNDCMTIQDIFARNAGFHKFLHEVIKCKDTEQRKVQLHKLNNVLDQIKPLRAVVLLTITIGPLSGTILDLGSGLLGFICNQTYDVDQELSVVAQSKIILLQQSHFELLQLHVGKNQFLELITVELYENVKKPEIQANVIQKTDDYAVLWVNTGILAGRYILFHCGDFCLKSYTEFSLQEGTTLNLSLDMISSLKINKSDFLNSTGQFLNFKQPANVPTVLLTELLDFDDLLCARKYSLSVDDSNFIYLNGASPRKSVGNSYEVLAVHSLAGKNAGVLKIDLEELLGLYLEDYDIKPGFYQFQTICKDKVTFRPASEVDRQPKSAKECQVGQKLHGYVTYADDRKVYIQVSRCLAGHILRHFFDYPGSQAPKKFQHVTFRVTKPLFKDCVAGVALQHILSETFCLASEIRERQLHICQIKHIGARHVLVDLADIWPPTKASVSIAMAARPDRRGDLHSLYIPGSFHYCVVVEAAQGQDVPGGPGAVPSIADTMPRIDVALTPEALIEAGFDPNTLKDLNKRKKMVDKVQKQKQNNFQRNQNNQENMLAEIKGEQEQDKEVDKIQTQNAQSDMQERNYKEESVYSYVYESEQEESLDFDQLHHQNDQIARNNIHSTYNTNNYSTKKVSLLELLDDNPSNVDEQKGSDESDNVSEQQLEPEDYERAIQKNKYSSYIFIKYAEYYVKLHQLQEAHKILERGLESLPLFDSELQNERANIQMVRISLIERYDDIETFFRQGIEILRAFEAPGLLGRRLAEKYLQKAATVSGQEKEKYTGFIERLFACLFKQKKRKRDLQLASLYVRYLFITGKAKRPELQQIAENIEGGSAMIGKMHCLIGSLYYEYKDEKLGYQFYLAGNKGTWDLAQVDKWCDDVEKDKNDVVVRDFYVSITKQSFNTKKEMKALQQFLRRFLDFEKQRGGEPGIVQQLTMELLSK